jgi:hypothetical protein
MKAAQLALWVSLAALSLLVYLQEKGHRAEVEGAFQLSSFTTGRPVIAAAAINAPYADFGAEIFAAAALRDWLTRSPEHTFASPLRDMLTRRPPWGYPHPWRWTEGDYASEYLAALAELNADRPAFGADADLTSAIRLSVSALQRRPAWPQHRKNLLALLSVGAE